MPINLQYNQIYRFYNGLSITKNKYFTQVELINLFDIFQANLTNQREVFPTKVKNQTQILRLIILKKQNSIFQYYFTIESNKNNTTLMQFLPHKQFFNQRH